MAIRNWWIEAQIDGHKTKLVGGPQAKDGGFELTIRQRDEGKSVIAGLVRGVVLPGGRLQLVLSAVAGNRSIESGGLTFTTER